MIEERNNLKEIQIFKKYLVTSTYVHFQIGFKGTNIIAIIVSYYNANEISKL